MISIAPASGSPPSLLPENWHSIPFNINGRESACTYMPAENPKALLALKHGYNSDSLQYDLRRGHPDAPNVFQQLNDQGISVITLASERIPPGDVTFVRRYEDEVQKFFFDPDSPIFEIAGDLPVHAVAHSLGGLATLKNLTRPENLQFASKHLDSINLMNPAIAIAHVTRFSLVDSFYRAWSNTFPDNIPGTTLVGKSYMAFMGIPVEEDNPTHNQIQIMAAEGKACREKLQSMVEGGTFKHDFDLGFIVGTKDPTTCWARAKSHHRAATPLSCLQKGLATPPPKMCQHRRRSQLL
jgi:hypothetical protein